MSNEKNYLHDFGAEVAQLAKRASNGTSNSEFEAGRRTALYEVITLMRQQAMAFGINDQQIGLDGYDAEALLIRSR